jgi:hypothetical protein
MLDWGFAQVDQQWYNTPALLADAQRMYTEVKTLQPKYWRIGAQWSLIATQKDPGTFVAGTPPTSTGRDWSTLDTALNEGLLLGSEIILILGVVRAKWGGFWFFGGTLGTNAEFGVWCAEVATRYKPGGVGIRTDGRYASNSGKGVRSFEIWNEQNDQGHDGGQINAKDYTERLIAAYDAIKGVSGLTGTPTPGTSPGSGQSRVLFGGTYHVQRIGNWGPGYGVASLPEVEYLAQCYTYGAKDKFDAMNVHVYPHLDASSYGGSDVGPVPTMNLDNMKQLVEIRALMVSKGDGSKKISVTEAGFPVSVVGETLQNTYWQTLYGLLSALPYVDMVLFYCARDGGGDVTSINGSLGAMRADFTHRPVWSWLQTLSPPLTRPASFAATASLSATIQRTIKANFTSASALTAYLPPRLAPNFTASSSMSAMVDLPGFRNALFTAASSMSATIAPRMPVTAPFAAVSSFTASVKPSLAVAASFTATGVMSSLIGTETPANFTTTSAMSASIHIPVQWDSTGAGNRTSGPSGSKITSWTHNTTVTGSDVWVFAAVAWSGGMSSRGCTYGGTPMTVVGANNSTSVGMTIFGLQNPPTGSQTVTATIGGTLYSIQGTSVSFTNIGAVVAPAVGASSTGSGTRSVTVPAGGGSRALAITAGNNANITVSPTQRYNGGTSVTGNGDYATVQDAPGEADGFVTLSTIQSGTGAWMTLGLVLNPV